MAPPWHLLLLVASVGAARCPDGTTCSEKTLCCELPGGNGYGCCPEGEVVARSLPMITSEISCTDRTGCPEEYSCVSTPQGGSACCPIAQGISCQDGHHCCPSGSHCSEDGHYCIPAANLSAVLCPDGRSECPSDTSCCQMADQSWGCCPLPQAICCNDHLHCCPHNTVCDLEHNKCKSENGEVPLSKKVPARVKLDSEKIIRRTPCQDGSSCPDGSTCCQQPDQSYGCCPFMSAVCCDDHVHCCPPGTTCDVAHKKCVGQNSVIPLFRKTQALREQATVKCDDVTECPGTSTCCRLASGEWGCCPFEKAVCCPDKVHCCPNGYTCDGGSCTSEAVSIPWYNKTPALKQDATVKCDDVTECPGTSTCCRLASGEWGCCPFEKAVCCPDKVHCCPNGFACDGGSCTSEAVSIPWSNKTPALKQDATVKCDDVTECPGTSTCCRLASGEWGCCPFEKAVCCPDKVHCCPNGYTCDGGSCTSEAVSIPWYNKTPAMKQDDGNVQCDAVTSCPDKTTCCRLPTGEWGCCPIEQVSEVKCDISHSCAQGTTCCHTEGGGWACCPLEEAVCCSDHLHCCPSGYTCDVSAGTCNKPLGDTKQPASALQKLGYVWCDATHACYDGQTCCVAYSGLWNCCPYTQGVCCPDRVHCCPYGHVCLNSGAQCSRSGNLRWDLGNGENPLL
ncbi:progranulin-like isoform X3 [Mixophyes fleayi]